MKSDVYFIKIEGSSIESRVLAFKKLFIAINQFLPYRKDELVALKITIGDSPCVYQLSPDLINIAVSEIKKKQAKPFLFDTCVIYKGQRQNAVDHLRLAEKKGFGYSKLGAPFIIADGLLGQDGKEYEINSAHIKKIKIPSFIGYLNSLLVLSHATGHIVSGFACAIKNVAMGMSCRPTKQVQHSSLKPNIISKNCTACGCCIAICPVGAISLKKEKAFINQALCIGCGDCICACKFDAVYINWQEEPEVFCKRMVEVANFILSKFQNKFFLNFAFDITKECDCISAKGEPMISADIGILASADILSLDKATLDLANKNRKTDFLKDTRHVYEAMFEYAKDSSMGNLEYNLIDV
jgi:hypothetical protein